MSLLIRFHYTTAGEGTIYSADLKVPDGYTVYADDSRVVWTSNRNETTTVATRQHSLWETDGMLPTDRPQDEQYLFTDFEVIQPMEVLPPPADLDELVDVLVTVQTRHAIDIKLRVHKTMSDDDVLDAADRAYERLEDYSGEEFTEMMPKGTWSIRRG